MRLWSRTHTRQLATVDGEAIHADAIVHRSYGKEDARTFKELYELGVVQVCDWRFRLITQHEGIEDTEAFVAALKALEE